MEKFDLIRKYFTPIQPSIQKGTKSIVYTEFHVHPQLKNYIHCYWQLNSNEKLSSPFKYKVVSDGCIDIFFNLKNGNNSFVMGFCKSYKEFSLGSEFNYAGIRFYPSIFPLLFGIPAKALSEKDQQLQDLLPELSDFIRSSTKEEFVRSIPKLDEFFCSICAVNKFSMDERFYQAYIEILRKKGNLKTEIELNTGLSSRQLRRLFNYYIGTTPKSFSQVIRFQYILNAVYLNRKMKEDKIFFDVGFFDQAHFIKNFTKFYGVTPNRAFG